MNRSKELCLKTHQEHCENVDTIFKYLFVVQWIAAIVCALLISPYTWIGNENLIHIHVYAAVFIGGLLALPPIFLTTFQPGKKLNRYVISISQICFSVLLIHLSGGRIETHFHIFGSLAILAFYRDWKIIALATIIIGLDHLLRGFFWPQSVYGVLYATPWRAFEHAVWVLYEDIVLFFAIKSGNLQFQSISDKQIELEEMIEQLKLANQTINSYRYALDTSSIVAITDAQGKIINVNDNFCQISKYSREELLGKTHQIINSKHHNKSFFENMWNTIHSGSVWKGEIKNKAKDNTSYWVDTSIVPIFDEYNKIKQFLAIRKDITEKKLLEEKILELNLTLEQKVQERTNELQATQVQLLHASKMSTLGEMAGGVAHEINNPLAIISSLSTQIMEQAEKGDLEKEQLSKTAEKLIKMSFRIAKIVKGLRTFSRSAEHDPMQDVNIKNMLEETISFLYGKNKKTQR